MEFVVCRLLLKKYSNNRCAVTRSPQPKKVFLLYILCDSKFFTNIKCTQNTVQYGNKKYKKKHRSRPIPKRYDPWRKQ